MAAGLYILQNFNKSCALMHKMRWDDLQFVHEVAEHGSLSAAARSLGVNHATVLRRISALEDRFGITLFERPPGGYRMTPEGRNILSALQAIDRTVNGVERALPIVGRGLHGRVRLNDDRFAGRPDPAPASRRVEGAPR